MAKVTVIERAKTALVLDHPFFATLLLRRPLIESKSVPTCGVDARGQVYYNPEWVEQFKVEQLVFILAHEVMHMVYQHVPRVGDRDKQIWNIAGDAVINDLLKESKVGEWPGQGVDYPPMDVGGVMTRAMDRTADAVYNELMQKVSQNGGRGKGKGQGSQGCGHDTGNIGDDLIEGEQLSPDEAQAVEAEIRMAVAQAAQAAKVAGNMPGALAKIIAELLEVKTPWYEILEKYMTDLVKGDYSWARPNKRYTSAGFYLPSHGTVPKMGEVVVQIDVSGSISRQELNYYNGHLKRIISQCNPEKVHVLYTDTQVQRHDIFECGQEVDLEFYSGGGTDMPAGFAYCEQENIDPEVFVCLTDGYTGWGSKPAFDVVWCISSKQEAPYGTNIHFELE
jgi:predicted metal-dependent peptidase